MHGARLEAEVLATRYEGEGDAQDRAEAEAMEAEAEAVEEAS